MSFSSERLSAALCLLLGSVSPALAGLPVPSPVAGVLGPVGLLAAAAAYVGYRLYTRRGVRGRKDEN